MKIFNQEIAFEIENKKRAAICCGVILLCFGYTVVNFFSEKPKPHPVPQSNQTQQTAGKGAAASSSDESVSISAPTLDALLKVNPFVGVQEMNAGTAGEGGRSMVAGNMPLPAIPRMAGSSPSSSPWYSAPRSVPLPVIPGRGSVPIPSSNIPSSAPSSSAPAPQGSSASVQGVLTGDDGENMAIMSDGRVVQEGDTYQDGRIAYIGGDGITFEDGHSISYK